MTTKYLALPEVLEMHRVLIDVFGGAHGLREPGALESALMRPQLGYYEDLVQEAAALLESLALNHPFVDGNKRVAFAVADTFLRLNGRVLQVESMDAYDFFISLFEAGTFRYEHLEPWIRQHLK